MDTKSWADRIEKCLQRRALGSNFRAVFNFFIGTQGYYIRMKLSLKMMPARKLFVKAPAHVQPGVKGARP